MSFHDFHNGKWFVLSQNELFVEAELLKYRKVGNTSRPQIKAALLAPQFNDVYL